VPAEQSAPFVLSISGYAVSVPTLLESEKVIAKTFRDFNDFPRSLANTFVNVSYLSVLCVMFYGDRSLQPCLLAYIITKLKPLLTLDEGSAR
jgi:hypothetical protein